MLLRSRTPLHRDLQSCGHFTEVFERPAFGRAAGKRVNDREVLNLCLRHGNARDSFRGRWKRREERERKMAHSISKLRTMGPVPGIDGVERFELRDAGSFHDSHQVQASIGNSPRTIRKANQRQHRTRRPDFGVNCARRLERGKRENDVADRPGANE
jgi:transposase